jgi:16S rRNA (cytidine1402-2'-O)-methyltransferase
MAILYIVATPIGNLKDITLRGLDILREADVVACEDTRHTKKLLSAYEIGKRLISCHANNPERGIAAVLEELDADKSVAYATDAGTPGLSDPGSLLAGRVREAGHAVIPVPGPSAMTALMSVAGIGGKTLTFEGFLSPKQGRRRRRLQELLMREENFLLYESPYRILKLLGDIADLGGERKVVIGREMTKIHEEFLAGTAKELLEELEKREKTQGEFSLLVAGKKKF